MISLRTLKLREFQKNEITLDELKEVLLRYHYSYSKNLTSYMKFQSEMERPLIITEIKGNYGQVSSVVFSVEGSPPKGEAILYLQSSPNEKYWRGGLIVIGNGKVSNKIELLTILKND